MVKVMKRFVTLLLALFAVQANAEIYKSVNAAGEVVYSDNATQGAEKVEMPALSTYKPPAAPPPDSTPQQVTGEQDIYKRFVITAPANEETIRNNLGILNISANLTPPLQTRLKHRVQFFLNGEPYGAPVAKTSLTMSNLDRGEYTLSAAVVNTQGETVIATDDVVLYMKRHSILNPP